MSTPDQPESPQLTRKQMRELRNTGATPVITDAAAQQPTPPAPATPVPSPAAAVPPATPASAAPQHPAPAPAFSAPLPRAAEPVNIAPAPVADSSVDLGTAPLTRRQARQQERIRTASVPVITPEVAAAHGAPAAQSTEAPQSVEPAPAMSSLDAPTALITGVPVVAPSAQHPVAPVGQPAAPVVAPAPQPVAPVAAPRSSTDDTLIFSGPIAPAPALPVADPAHPLPDHVAAPADDDLRIFEDEGGPLAPEEARATVNPSLGAGLLGAGAAARPDASFDDLLQRDTATAGSIAGPSTLIVSQMPTGSSLVAPVTATGEVLVTGSWNLPDGMGSTGHAPGTTDGKEVDAALVDGELPTHSSPTPISASAAVSTAVTPDEIITPPAPEKGNKLMLTLAVTAGVLAVALIGVLVFALVTGVFK